MINEANSAPSHRDMIELLRRYIKETAAGVQVEYTLPNGKRADLAYASIYGQIHVIEVKTIVRPYLLSSALNKYSRFCHYLWLAAPEGEPGLSGPTGTIWHWGTHEDRIGMIAVSWDGPRVHRSALLLDGVPLNARLTLDRLRKGIATGEPARCS